MSPAGNPIGASPGSASFASATLCHEHFSSVSWTYGAHERQNDPSMSTVSRRGMVSEPSLMCIPRSLMPQCTIEENLTIRCVMIV